VFGFAGVFGATTLVLLIGAVAVVLMGVPTRGRSLEDIAASTGNDRLELVESRQ
jgi:putative MFS transporter